MHIVVPHRVVGVCCAAGLPQRPKQLVRPVLHVPACAGSKIKFSAYAIQNTSPGPLVETALAPASRSVPNSSCDQSCLWQRVLSRLHGESYPTLHTWQFNCLWHSTALQTACTTRPKHQVMLTSPKKISTGHKLLCSSHCALARPGWFTKETSGKTSASMHGRHVQHQTLLWMHKTVSTSKQ